ncbi:MAG TPA: hypothetical protein PLV92_20460, partial [Pirellulaceae bacterium]|nr:hypothetical protein [Pirellulaceae bacterium]
AGAATGGGRGALPGLAPAGAMPGMGAAIPGAGGLVGGPGMPGMGMPGGLLGGGGGGAIGGMMPSLGGGMGGGGLGGGLAQDPPVFRLKPPQPQRPYQAPTAGRIEQALVKVGDWQGIELPLSDFVAMIRKEHGINVTLEKKAIEAAGASTDITLSYNLKGVSLESALALVLKPKELEWSSRGDILQITTPDVASSRRSTIVYDVADLTSSAEQLAAIIVGQLSAGEWTDVGGGGSMAADAATGRERLVVTQSASMQRRVQGLLNSLRQASVKRPKQGGAEAVALSAEGYWRATEASAKIRAALGADAAFDFVDIPLTEAVKSLADKHAINLIVDIHELANIGVAPDSPVSLSLSDVTLDRALDELLSDLGLGYVVEHDALVITSQSEAAAPKIAVYPVGDLVADGRSVEQLSKLVYRTVLPDTWVGQNAQMLLVDLDRSQQALLVGQSTEGHRRVADLLTELRRRDEKPAETPN